MLQWKNARLIALLVSLGTLAAAFGKIKDLIPFNWGW